jgi:hypothetical protein
MMLGLDLMQEATQYQVDRAPARQTPGLMAYTVLHASI